MTDATFQNATAATTARDGPLLAADGVPLRRKLAQTTAQARRRAFYLTLPLVLFILISFVLPIGELLVRSFYNPVGGDVVPTFAEAIDKWDGKMPNVTGSAGPGSRPVRRP